MGLLGYLLVGLFLTLAALELMSSAVDWMRGVKRYSYRPPFWRWVLTGMVLSALVWLAGCGHTEYVRVPVAADCPEPPAVTRPTLPIAELDEHAAPATVVRDYAATVEALKGYARYLETILEGYRDGE